MAGQRYSRIVAASRYAKALDNYIKYVSGTAERQGKIGNGTKRTKSIALMVDPFGLKTTTKQFAECSGSETAYNDLKSFVTGYVREAKTLTTGESTIKARSFSAARISAKTGADGTATPTTSKITGMKYLKYTGKSFSVPFGKKETTDVESAVFTTIKTAMASTSYRVSWIRERN